MGSTGIVYKDILIGGNGFIGWELCQAFRDKKRSVLSISRNVRPKIAGIYQEKCDVANKNKLRELLKGGENVYILIGQISPSFEFDKEVEYIRGVLENLDKNTIKKVFYFSSVLLYGEVSQAANESCSPNPIDDYGRFKAKCEKMVLENAKKNNFLAGVLRLSNVYGKPGNRGLIGIVMEKLIKEKVANISLNGDGKQLRDYIYIEDVVEAVMNISEKLLSNDTINVAGGQSYSLIDVMENIKKELGGEIFYEIKGNQVNEIKKSLVSNEKLITKYQTRPRFDLRSGLKSTWGNYNKFYGGI